MSSFSNHSGFSKQASRAGISRILKSAVIATALTTAVVCAAVAVPQLHISDKDRVARGPGATLKWVEASRLPTWAQSALTDGKIENVHALRFSLADINRDDQPEILISAAERRFDVYIADSPLRALWQFNGVWQTSNADVACRPDELGPFATNGVWDLHCRSGSKNTLLRWDSGNYRQTI